MSTLFSSVDDGSALDPTAPLTPSGNLRRRDRFSRFIRVAATISAILAVALLADVAYTVVQHGAGALSIGFLTHNIGNGGIGNALLGTGVIVGSPWSRSSTIFRTVAARERAPANSVR